MASKLRDLRIKRIDFVDRGANPGATINLFKLDTRMPEETPSVADLEAKIDALTKQATDAEELQKRLTDAEAKATALAERVAKAEEQRERESLIRKAAGWKGLGKADDLGGALYELKKALPAESFAKFETHLAAWNEQIIKSALFSEIGSTSDAELDAEGKLDKLAEEYHSKHEGETFESAYAKVLQTSIGKQLYGQIVAKRKES